MEKKLATRIQEQRDWYDQEHSKGISLTSIPRTVMASSIYAL